MERIVTPRLTKLQKEEIMQLWNKEYPKELVYDNLEEFDAYLDKLSNKSHTLIAAGQKIKGWCLDFTRENEKWFAMIIHSSVQGQGFGTALLHAAKQKTAVLNGWVIADNTYRKLNGEAYNSPLEFYIKNGFKIITGEILDAKISAVKIRWAKPGY